MAEASVTIRYNDIPKTSSLKKKLDDFFKKNKDRVQYRVIGSHDPVTGKHYGKTLRIPKSDVVQDSDGNVYDIAYVEGAGPGGKQKVGEIWFHDYNGSLITLFVNSAKDRKQIEYLELCNYLTDNDNRDKSAPAFIERVDDTTDFKIRRDKRRKVHAALSVIEGFSDDEVLNFTRASKLPDKGTEDKRRFFLEEFAEKDPDKFLNSPIADYTALYEVIDEAKGKKIINYNTSNATWFTFDGGEIRKIKKGVGVSNKEELAKFLMTPDGSKHLDRIRAELEK